MPESALTRADAAAVIRRLLQDHLDAPREDVELPDDLRLDENGLGLDSIVIVEVLLECEERYGVSPIPLLEGGPIRVGDLIDHVLPA